MPHLLSSPASDKAALRAQALARRAGLDAAVRRAAAEAAALHAAAFLAPANGRIVALFAPIGAEIDTAPLAALLRAAGATLALPVVVDMDGPLIFRLWRADEALVPSLGPGRRAIPAPPPGAPQVRPERVVVPLAAFDSHGQRIGYGRGHYDRTLAQLRRLGPVPALGYAFAVQQVAHVPAEPHDEPLDAIATDAGLLRRAGD
ncbi:MAG: 5-formyltetrahydrofolate cyclo-ligase [Xanthobacteraceae bacterium]